MKGFIKWALIATIINVIFQLIEYATFDETTAIPGERGALGTILQWLGVLIGLTVLYLGIREKKMNNPSEFTFGKGFTEGLLISVFAGLFIGIFSFIFFKFVAPEVMDFILTGSLEAMSKQGMPADQIEKAKPMMEFFISPLGFLLTTLITYTIGGLIVSLIMSAIVNATGPRSGGAEPVSA